MDWKNILVTALIVVAVMLVLKKTGLGAKIGLNSYEDGFESDVIG